MTTEEFKAEVLSRFADKYDIEFFEQNGHGYILTKKYITGNLFPEKYSDKRILAELDFDMDVAPKILMSRSAHELQSHGFTVGGEFSIPDPVSKRFPLDNLNGT